MKTLFATLTLALGLIANTLAQNTNVVAVAETPEDSGRQVPFTLEVMLGGGGVTTSDGGSSFGTDFSIGINPIESLPAIWVGVVQGLYWEPEFSGSTDLYADYSFLIHSDTLYLNLGWSGGVVYDTESSYWRTGPEMSFQYYVTDEAFIYVGANYDFNLNSDVEDGLRYGFGIGLNF
jgi:hypothetical protein